MTTTDKNARTANLFANIGTAVWTRGIKKGVEETLQIQRQSMEDDRAASARTDASNQKRNQLLGSALIEEKKQTAIAQKNADDKKKEREKKEEIKALMDIFFNLSEDLNDLENSKSSTLEKYFKLHNIIALFNYHRFTSELGQNTEEKKLITETFRKKEKLEGEFSEQFVDQDELDFEAIMQILEHDEEQKIKKLRANKSHPSKLLNQYKKAKEELNKADIFQIIDSHKKIIEKLKK